jgi:hypothetical protein
MGDTTMSNEAALQVTRPEGSQTDQGNQAVDHRVTDEPTRFTIRGGHKVYRVKAPDYGTLGAIVTKIKLDKKGQFDEVTGLKGLSAAHVLYSQSSSTVGNRVMAQNEDQAKEQDIGQLDLNYWGRVSIATPHTKGAATFSLDYALVDLDDRVPYEKKVLGLGSYSGTGMPATNTRAGQFGKGFFYGATTRTQTEGSITSLTESRLLKVKRDAGTKEESEVFNGLMKVDFGANDRFRKGDSGSVLYNESNQILGMLIAGEEEGDNKGRYGYAIAIQPILAVGSIRLFSDYFDVRDDLNTKKHLMRYYDRQRDLHMITATDELEKDRTRWKYESTIGYALPHESYNAGTTNITKPIYRYFHPGTGDHMLTDDWFEHLSSDDGKGEYKPEGVPFYVYAFPEPDLIPMWRVQRKSPYRNFYTTDTDEAHHIVNTKSIDLLGYVIRFPV